MSETQTTQKAPASTVGLRNVVFCRITADTAAEGETAGSTTYGDVKKLAGAMSAEISNNSGDANIQYGDDGEMDALYPDPEIVLSLELADLPPDKAAELLGATIDEKGVMIAKAEDVPPYIAMGFISAKANGADRYIWLYKGRAKYKGESYATKKGKDITRQSGKLDITFIKRLSDGAWQAKVDSDTAAFASAKASFFTAPYTPAYSGT